MQSFKDFPETNYQWIVQTTHLKFRGFVSHEINNIQRVELKLTPIHSVGYLPNFCDQALFEEKFLTLEPK